MESAPGSANIYFPKSIDWLWSFCLENGSVEFSHQQEASFDVSQAGKVPLLDLKNPFEHKESLQVKLQMCNLHVLAIYYIFSVTLNIGVYM